MHTESSVQCHEPIVNVSAVFLGKNGIDDIATTFSNWVSMESHWLLNLHIGSLKGYGMALTHNEPICSVYWPKCHWQYSICLLQWSVHGASMIFGQTQYATQQWTALHCCWIEFYAVSLFNMSLYTTSQIYMQCLTDLIFCTGSSRVNILAPTLCCTMM